MKSNEIIRGWKEEESPREREARAGLPENPAGLIELTDAELGGIEGAGEDRTWGGCHSLNGICPGSNGLFCSFWGCGTGDWGACSFFGCASWSWPLCI
ncbi:MAG: mersacidin/lichenicidin family type 2 lantibiotic [Blastocatellia bacterium]|nr:mersacidin/lichenicidin family type 2 lantibiotic [Blastocatellia bacterium]